MSDVKETKAQRVERLKREKNAWDNLEEIRKFAREGHAAITPEWMGTYLRTWGLYTQGDGIGAIGGSGGEGKSTQYFMLRVRIPNGILSSSQLRVLADLSQRYARGLADITVRQNIQFHWIRIEDAPILLDELASAGISTVGACGDVTRNITGCPLAGVSADEVFDASPFALQLERHFLRNSEFYNLPRKFKISITGCHDWCSYPEINDVGLTAVIRKRGSGDERGFALRIGGGLSTQPHLALKVNAFVPENKVVDTVHTIAEIFRDANVLRQSREAARFKFLFLKHGWNADTLLDQLQRRLGYRFDPAEPEDVPSGVFRDHVGIHPQKQSGLSYVGASVLRGRMSADQLFAVADLANRLGGGEVRTTILQNLIFVNVPNTNTATLAKELNALGLPVEPSVFWRGAVACTGTEFCKLAIAETKSFTRWIVEELEGRIPEFTEQLRLNVTGCPNSCGQHWIADLGLEGKKLKIDGKMQDAYYFCVGGSVGREQAIARPVGYRIQASEVPAAIERLLRSYLKLRQQGENLRQFFGRHNNEAIRSFLAGTSVESAPRAIPQGPVPHGVES